MEEVEHDSDILRRFVVFLFFVREHWHLPIYLQPHSVELVAFPVSNATQATLTHRDFEGALKMFKVPTNLIRSPFDCRCDKVGGNHS